MSSRWKERNAKTKKDEKRVGESPCYSEEGVLAWEDKFVWTSGSERGKVRGSREKFSGGEEGAERRMGLLGARVSAELGQVTSGSATQGLWLGSKKVRSQVISENQSRLLGRRTIGEFWGGRR